MSARGPKGALLALVIAGCTPTATVELPSVEGARSAIVAATSARGIALHAIDLAGGGGLGALDLPGPSLSLNALVYTAPLSDFGLEPGPLRVAIADERSRGLPGGAAFFEGAIDGGTFTGWSPTAALPEAVAAVRIPRGSISPCRGFEVSTVELDTDTWVTFVVPLDRDTVFVGTDDHRFHRATRRRSARLDLAAGLPHGAAYGAGPYEIWLGGDGGRLVKVDPNQGFRVTDDTVTPSLDRDRFVDIDGAAQADPIDIVTIGQSGIIARYDGRGWQRLKEHDPVEQARYTRKIVWVGRGELIAATTAPELSHYRDGQRLNGTLEREVREVNAVARVQGLGYVAAAQGGTFYQAAPPDFEWKRLGSLDFKYSVLDLAPLGEGFLFAGTSGWYGVYAGGGEFCDPANLDAGAPTDWMHAVALDEDTVVLAGRRAPGNPRTVVVFLDQKKE